MRHSYSFFARNVSIVQAITCVLFTEPFELIDLSLPSERKKPIKIGNLVNFVVNETEATFLLQLSKHFALMLQKLLSNPITFHMMPNEVAIWNVLIDILENQDDITIYLQKKTTQKDEGTANVEGIINN